MNIILLTVLLTLLGSGLVVLLAWLSVGSWKSIKFRKKSKIKFEDLSKNLEESIHSIYAAMEERNADMNNIINEIHNLINQDIQIEASHIQEVRDYTDNRFKDIEHLIDSRFDKLHNLRNQDIQTANNCVQELRNYTVDRFKETEHVINYRCDKQNNLSNKKKQK